MMLLDLSKLFIQLLLPRQYKGLKPAKQSLRQPQAPHHAGRFLFWLMPPNSRHNVAGAGFIGDDLTFPPEP